jgi:hypothetical protein
VVKGAEAEKKPQLHARSDLELIRSLPGSPGLLSDLEVSAVRVCPDASAVWGGHAGRDLCVPVNRNQRK